jgi:hypothetical protein
MSKSVLSILFSVALVAAARLASCTVIRGGLAIFSFAVIALTAQLPALASTSGSAGSWNFVAPVTSLGGALQAITGPIVIIALVVIVGQHLMHREDWGGMFRNVVFVLIGGAIILAAGNFMTNAGVTGATF